MFLYDFRAVNNWFYENVMILNPGKCHVMSIGKDTHDKDGFNYDGFNYFSSKVALQRKC